MKGGSAACSRPWLLKLVSKPKKSKVPRSFENSALIKSHALRSKTVVLDDVSNVLKQVCLVFRDSGRIYGIVKSWGQVVNCQVFLEKRQKWRKWQQAEIKIY